MTNKRIPDLTAATTPLAGTELVPVWDSATKKVTISDLTAGRAVSMASGTATGKLTASSGTFSGASISGVTAATKLSTDLIGTYPNGLSFTAVNGGTGWPLAVTQGVLITYYTDTYGADGLGFSFQEFVCRNQATAGNRRTFRRYPSTIAALAPWGNWLETIVADTSTGNVSVTGGNYVPVTSGKGIDFSAATSAAGMTSKVLSNYEEGNWTPTQGTGLTVVGTFSSNGHYTRTGRLVTVTANLAATTSLALVGAGMLCGGLPFTVGAQSTGVGTNGARSIAYTVFADTTSLYGTVAIAATPSLIFSCSYVV